MSGNGANHSTIALQSSPYLENCANHIGQCSMGADGVHAVRKQVRVSLGGGVEIRIDPRVVCGKLVPYAPFNNGESMRILAQRRGLAGNIHCI